MAYPEKAFLLTESGEQILCAFNPSELRFSKSNRWSEARTAPGQNAPNLEFQQGQPAVMSVNLLFDTSEQGTSVSELTSRLMALTKVDSELPGSDPERNKGRPPWVRFHWGEIHSFKGVVESLEITYDYFTPRGRALSAKASLTLKQYEDEGRGHLQNPTSHTPNLHTIHQVRPGETLDRIASTHYGDPGRWRLIAAANGVLDPLSLTPGASLVIPEPRGVRRG